MVSVDEDLAFRIFCLFNRFCETDVMPMKLSPQALYLMYSWLSISEPPNAFIPSFGNILANIFRRKDSYSIIAAKQAYDQYVRDILIEQRLMIKIKRVTSKNGSNYVRIGKTASQNVLYKTKL